MPGYRALIKREHRRIDLLPHSTKKAGKEPEHQRDQKMQIDPAGKFTYKLSTGLFANAVHYW